MWFAVGKALPNNPVGKSELASFTGTYGVIVSQLFIGSMLLRFYVMNGDPLLIVQFENVVDAWQNTFEKNRFLVVG